MTTKKLCAATSLAVVAAGATMLLPGAAFARGWEASGGSSMHVVHGSDLDAVSENDVLAMGELGVAMSLVDGAPILGRVWIEARWEGGRTSAVDFGLWEATLDTTTLQLGLRGMREVWPRVSVLGRVAVGAAHGAFSVREAYQPDYEPMLEGSDWTWAASASAGVELAILDGKPGTAWAGKQFAFRLELGWATTGALDLEARPQGADDAGLPTRGTDVGDLALGGARVGVGFAFRW